MIPYHIISYNTLAHHITTSSHIISYPISYHIITYDIICSFFLLLTSNSSRSIPERIQISALLYIKYTYPFSCFACVVNNDPDTCTTRTDAGDLATACSCTSGQTTFATTTTTTTATASITSIGDITRCARTYHGQAPSRLAGGGRDRRGCQTTEDLRLVGEDRG